MLGVLALGAAATARATSGLPTYSIDPESVTIAGISSGAFMAVQMHVAWSSRIHGAAIFAGGPFYCAQDSVANATGACASGSGLLLQALTSYTSTQVNAGALDPTIGLASAPIYLFSGTADTTVHQAVMNALAQYYESYVSSSDVTYDDSTAAAHGWISPDGPNGCDTSYSPFINDCGIDPEETFLTLFYGALNPKNAGSLGGSFLQFDQTPFCAGGSCSAISMDGTGWLYVPQSCGSGQACRLIVVLHGCLQSQSLIGQAFVQESGVDEWADTNGIVVLYPQAIASLDPLNPDGCWDWWGYTGSNYALQTGAQMQTLMAMIEQVIGPQTGSTGGASTSASSTSATGATSGGAATSGASAGSTAGTGTGSSSGTTGSTSTSGATPTSSSARTTGGAGQGATASAGSGNATGSGAGSGGCSSGPGPSSGLAFLTLAALRRRRTRRPG